MKPKQWRHVKELCASALELDPVERKAFLEKACHEDKLLLKEVQSLLSFELQAQAELEILPLEVVNAAFGNNMPLIGHKIGNYLVRSLLGCGGMGDVYLAEETNLRRKVALKVLPKEFVNDEERLQRFNQEARTASALKHRNIITIYTVGQDDGVYFIATEYVQGPTLRQRLSASGRLELHEAINIAEQIASALEAAHRAGIVHRDVKPENIIFEPDGTVKLLDFGIAKLTETFTEETIGEAAELPKTEQGVILGTPAYMSPEQARHQPLDYRSDLFSLGVVLYEMITGNVPFAGNTPYDQQAAMLTTEPIPVEQQLGRSIAELEWVISKALTKEPGRRYQTATDMLNDLQRLNQRLQNEESSGSEKHAKATEAVGTSVEAGSTTSINISPIKGWWRRSRRVKLLATVIAILCLLATTLWVTGFGQRLARLLGLYGPPPLIESIVPNKPIDAIGDQSIEVHGRHFKDGLKIKVGFPDGGSGELSGAQIQKQEGNTTSFDILINFNDNPGTYTFQLLNPDGQVSPPFAFDVRHEMQQPVIDWIEPANPKTSSGEQPVAVYGRNFQIGFRVEVMQPNGNTSELRDRQIAGRTSHSFHGLFFFYLPGKHSIRVVNPNGGKSEYFDIFVQ